MRKITYHHGALEQALLDEAVAQVRRLGAEQVSLRGLAKQVGVSASAAYQHFPDKAALLAAVGQWCFAELERQMVAEVAAVTASGAAGAMARFAAVGRAYVQFAAQEPHLFRHMFSALMAVKDGGRLRASAFPDCLEPGAPAGGDGEPPPGPYGVLIGALVGLAQHDLLRPGLVTAGASRSGEPSVMLDLVAWSVVHGFSSLVVEGHVAVDVGASVLFTFGRMVLREDVLDDEQLRHALAPVAQLPVREVISGAHILTDLTLGLGTVVHDYLAK